MSEESRSIALLLLSRPALSNSTRRPSMEFRALRLAGAHVIDVERSADERGFFARSFCAREFAAHDLMTEIAQTNVSFNAQRGTLRGLHYQTAPHEEAKVVRCVRGAVWDVIVDLREASTTFCEWFGTELSQDNQRALYVPEGFAHGFITLTDETELLYLMSEFYEPGAGRGVRWDDPAFGIDWPTAPVVMSERDRSYPDFSPT